MFSLSVHMWVAETQSKEFWRVQKCPSNKAAATWTGGAYEGAREHGQGARTPLAAFFNTPEKAVNA